MTSFVPRKRSRDIRASLSLLMSKIGSGSAIRVVDFHQGDWLTVSADDLPWSKQITWSKQNRLASPHGSISRDAFVRLFHWTLLVSFTVAYLTEDDPLTVHVWAGYMVGALIVARIVWGFVGSSRARFSDFLYKPTTTLRYVRDLVLFRGGERHLGHSPGGGYMVILLLVVLAATVVTGLMTSMAVISRQDRLLACSLRRLARRWKSGTKSSPTSRSL